MPTKHSTFVTFLFLYVSECTRSNTDLSMTTERGVIASPRPQESNHISRCFWRITAPADHRLKFTLLFYNISGFVSCQSKSEVIIYDGISSASDVLERFCLAKSNTVVYTRGRQMMVEMTLYESIYLDFLSVYEVVKMDEGESYDTVETLCNGHIEDKRMWPL